MTERPREAYDIPWDDAVLIVGSEAKLVALLRLNERRASRTRYFRKRIPIQLIGKEIYRAWKSNQQVSIDVVRKQGYEEGYDRALADRRTAQARADAAVEAEAARLRAARD